jgi:hypothetical protein
MDSEQDSTSIIKYLTEALGPEAPPWFKLAFVFVAVILLGFLLPFLKKIGERLGERVVDGPELAQYKESVLKQLDLTIERLVAARAPHATISALVEYRKNASGASANLAREFVKIAIQELKGSGYNHLTKPLLALYAVKLK